MHNLGDKLRARALAKQCGIPLLPGSSRVESAVQAEDLVRDIGYPVLLKASAGGGGRGMKVATDAISLRSGFETATAEALASFGDGTLFLERFVPRARHVEVQILGDGEGGIIHLGERDCSVQRRYQKVIEEAPAPALAAELVQKIRDAAVRLANAAGYRSAGTVEFLVDPETARYYFLEVNTRIQVEHPVTEMVTGIDIVGEQLRIASGTGLSQRQDGVRFSGHAIEMRINAESPAHGFRPSPGRIAAWRPPVGSHIRLDTHCHEGYLVPPYYDSLLAKLIVTGCDRPTAIENARQALANFVIEGVQTTLPFLERVLAEAAFHNAAHHTRWAEELLQQQDGVLA
jgi:acetyl-CoA carboxylase biotin carboxylase subunit